MFIENQSNTVLAKKWYPFLPVRYRDILTGRANEWIVVGGMLMGM